MNTIKSDTIVALSTPPGNGAIGVIRISGEDAITIANSVFKGKNLLIQPTHTIHYGTIVDNQAIIDEVLVALFKAPKSFTKENVVEFSCHGSNYIIQKVIRLLLEKGARLAKEGEYTMRAFANGQLDLVQAEAIADLIKADSPVSHKLAINQMRGGFSNEIKRLRSKLIHFASLVELELDFSEEDVEFADRKSIKSLLLELLTLIKPLITSFKSGNVIKNGISVVIIGKPNAGKSTLLNVILNEDKAIVSDMPGTTRDVIEDNIVLGGINFRFIDTAGLREARDEVEKIGIQRTQDQMNKSFMIIYLVDMVNDNIDEVLKQLKEIKSLQKPYMVVGNKMDSSNEEIHNQILSLENSIIISSLKKLNVDRFKNQLLKTVNTNISMDNNIMISNSRHYESLLKTYETLTQAINTLDNQLTNDLLASDIRQSLLFLGEITGEIVTDDLLDNIFSKFCIGK